MVRQVRCVTVGQGGGGRFPLPFRLRFWLWFILSQLSLVLLVRCFFSMPGKGTLVPSVA